MACKSLSLSVKFESSFRPDLVMPSVPDVCGRVAVFNVDSNCEM